MSCRYLDPVQQTPLLARFDDRLAGERPREGSTRDKGHAAGFSQAMSVVRFQFNTGEGNKCGRNILDFVTDNNYYLSVTFLEGIRILLTGGRHLLRAEHNVKLTICG